ncbi:hypothetical protein X386_01968 [Mycobacterium tuberculosis XTB13-179]|nr:hypothetical protein X386_01968 [Mycobacterium tuberculosis XTB13-179]
MRWGVESICTQLTELGVPIAPSTYYDHINREPSRRELRDGELKEHISRVHAANYGVYGARKVWLTLNREGIEVARCTVERLMTKLGLSGTTRGKARRTTIADPATARPADLVQRRFGPPAPNRLWVADLTYVSTWAGFAYVAFVTDAYARRILGWRVASTMATSMVLDAIEQAIWTRQQEGVLDLKDVIHHTDRGSQYTSIRFSERLAEAGIQPSVGAVGSSYDNALAETINGLYKTELIKPGKPWRSIEDVELATARWVDWFNHRRLYQYCGDVPPVELEAATPTHPPRGEPPRHVRRLQFLERMGSCQVVHRGGTRRSCVSGRCGWSQRSAVSTIRSGQRSVRSPVYLVLAARRRCVSGCARRRSMPAHGPGPRPKNPLS